MPDIPGCGQVHIVINSCILILYFECWYVFVLVLLLSYSFQKRTDVLFLSGFSWLCCAIGQCFNLRFMYLILMYIDISCEMFTLIDDNGVVLCMCVYVYMW